MRAPVNRHDTALEVLEGLLEFATRLRGDGWEVNVACETGGPERISFSAQRAAPHPLEGART